MWTEDFQMFKLDLERTEEPKIKLPISIGSSKKQESSTKKSTSAALTMLKPLTVWITTNCGKFLETGIPASCKTCIQVKKQQNWKSSVFISISKKRNAKECSNYCTVVLISHTSKVILKILQGRLQYYMNQELSDVQAEFWKGRGTGDQIANIH